MEVPPEPVDDAGPLRDQVLPVRELRAAAGCPARGPRDEPSAGRLTESSPRHSQGVDRVGLAEGPSSVSTVTTLSRDVILKMAYEAGPTG
jgi:hypothetical protein